MFFLTACLFSSFLLTTHGSLKRFFFSWDWSNRWLWVVMWVLEIKSPWRTDSALNSWTLSLAHTCYIFKWLYIFWWLRRVNSNHFECENNKGMRQVVSFWVFRHSSQLKGWSSGTGFLIISLLIEYPEILCRMIKLSRINSLDRLIFESIRTENIVKI